MQPANLQVIVLVVCGLAIPCVHCVTYVGIQLWYLEAGETSITLRWTDIQAVNAADPTMTIGTIVIDLTYGYCARLGDTPGSCDGPRTTTNQLTQDEALKANYTIENLENGTWYFVCFKSRHETLTLGSDCTMIQVGVTKGIIQPLNSGHLYHRDNFQVGARSILANYTVSNEIFTLQNLDIYLKDRSTDKRIDGNVTVGNTGMERIFMANISGLKLSTTYWFCTAPLLDLPGDDLSFGTHTSCSTFTTASYLQSWEMTDDNNSAETDDNNSAEPLAIANWKTKLYILALALGTCVLWSGAY